MKNESLAVTVVLGGQEYLIVPLNLRASRIWRQTLGQPVAELVNILSQANTLELKNPADLAKILNMVHTHLIGSPDLVFEAVCGYSPSIKEDRERLETEALDAEIIDVLGVILKLAFPFSRLVNNLTNSRSG